MGNTFYFQWEVELMKGLQAHMGGTLTALAKFFSMFGEEMILVAVLGFLYWCYDKKYGKYVGINLLVSTMLNPWIKNIFIRRRPYFDNPEIKCLKAVDSDADIYNISAQGYSFPSGHSMSASGTYGAIAIYRRNKIKTIIAGIIILGVGVSRFCLGVHYPTDVLVGWAGGFATLFVVTKLQQKIEDSKKLYILLAVCGLPGFFYCTSTDFYTAYGLMVGAFAGFLFDEKYVQFENTRKVIPCILRIVCGIAIFFALNTILKMPFSASLLESETTAAFLIRAVRYCLVAFVVIGVYPMSFKLFDRK